MPRQDPQMRRRDESLMLPVLPLEEHESVLLPGGFLRLSTRAFGNARLVKYLLSDCVSGSRVASTTTGKTSDPDAKVSHGKGDGNDGVGGLAKNQKMENLHDQIRSDSSNDAHKTVGDIVVAPVMISHLTGGKSIDIEGDEEDEDDRLDLNSVHNIGCAARVIEIARMKTGDWSLVLEGRARVALHDVSLSSKGIYVATCTQIDNFIGTKRVKPTKEEIAMQGRVLRGIRTMFEAAPRSQPEVVARTLHILKSYGPSMTADIVGALLARTFRQRLSLLSTIDVRARLKMVENLLTKQLESALNDTDLNEDHRVNSSSKSDSIIRWSQNTGNRKQGYPVELLARLKSKNPPQDVLNAAKHEIQKLRSINEQHPSYAGIMSYLEVLADLPWRVSASGNSEIPSLRNVKHQLDEDHYGLEKVKERMIQFVAVQNLRGWAARAPVLCLVGPPGVGKTSLAKSIASALNRPFQRISLGGVRDEAEIRGHRRTYIGAFPGRIITALRRAKVSDPVLLLDEVDKTGKDSRGDPASALLEVLDPEQNSTFVDTYLGIPVDLSQVVFIATANSAAQIPPPLLDRMEIVNLHSYTTDEKVVIGEQYLIPRVLKEHGIGKEQMEIPRNTIKLLIEGYTREAGVRQLDKYLAALCRHVAVELVRNGEKEGKASSLAGNRKRETGNVPQSNSLPNPHVDRNIQSKQVDTEQMQTDQESSLETGNNFFRTSVADISARKLKNRNANGINWQLLGPGSMGFVSSDDDTQKDITKYSSNTSVHHEKCINSNVAQIEGDPYSSNSTTYHREIKPFVIDKSFLETVLGPKRFRGAAATERIASPGAAAGLVWTSHGGQVQYIECLCVGISSEGKRGSLTLTGQLGDVLEESAHIAVSWARAHALNLGLKPLEEGSSITVAHALDVHIHLPSGGVPKDGPSAGVTLAVALVSLYTGKCARGDTALTGELTLRGLVLPVGGIKEKIMAAEAAGMKRVILPSQNIADAKSEVPEAILNRIELVGIDHLEQALASAFDPPLCLVEDGFLSQPHLISKL